MFTPGHGRFGTVDTVFRIFQSCIPGEKHVRGKIRTYHYIQPNHDILLISNPSTRKDLVLDSTQSDNLAYKWLTNHPNRYYSNI